MARAIGGQSLAIIRAINDLLTVKTSGAEQVLRVYGELT